MLIDTHAHVNFDAFKDDADEVIRRSLAENVQMINVGSQYPTSKRAIEISEKYKEGVYAAVGLHPIHVNDEEFNYEEYKKLALRSLGEGGVVAIGEIGLDYYRASENKNIQRTVLCRQLDLAKELNLPVIFHCRNAHDDLVNELKNYELNGVIHCFTGTWMDAQKYLEMGLYLGINGIIFKTDLNEVIKKVPLNKILLETDCPYLTPAPMTGRNDPSYIKYVAEKIAELKGKTFEKVAEATTQNAKKLFRI